MAEAKRIEAKDTHTNHYDFPTFVLKRADRKLAGRVLDNNGKPLTGAQVSFGGQGQPRDSTTKADSEGKFLFDSLCEGQIKVFVHYQDPLDSSIYMSLNGGGGLEAQAGHTNLLIILRDTSISGWDVPTFTTMGQCLTLRARPRRGWRWWCGVQPIRLRGLKAARTGVSGRWQHLLGTHPGSAGQGASDRKPLLVGRDPRRNLVVTHELEVTVTNLDLYMQTGLTLAGTVPRRKWRRKY